MEGTTIGRTGTSDGFPTEGDLEEAFAQAFRATKGIHFVWTSSQNIDRLVTIFRAAKKTGRVLIIDLYTAVILEATGRDRVPQSNWPEVRLYVPYAQRIHIKNNELFSDLERHSVNRIYQKALSGLSEHAVMLFRPLMKSDHGVQSVLDGARLTYSMWQGYLKTDSVQRVTKWLEDNGVLWESIHTSGHASLAERQRFAKALAPRRLVPIHSFETHCCPINSRRT